MGKKNKIVKGNEKSNTKKIAPTAVKAQPKALDMPPKVLIEEKIKIFLAIILFLLFLTLFASVVYYFLTQVDATLVNATASIQGIFSLF